MHVRLHPKAAERLARILGMLGSDFDGERAAAARKATQFLGACGITWRDLAMRAATEAAPPAKQDPGHSARALWALERGHRLDAWQRGFLHSIARRRKPLTPRQAEVLERICDAVKAAERRA